MTLEIETPMILRARKVKGVDEGQPFYAWRKENQEGRTLVEGSWKKGRRHGTWIYYDSAGNVLRSERYRRGKLKNK
jgi:antitoxin component YwqK of YwqJK toxin-antitoxin module